MSVNLEKWRNFLPIAEIVVGDRDEYEREIPLATKEQNGIRFENGMDFSYDSLEELNYLKDHLNQYGFPVTLKEAEYCWSMFSSDCYYASWLDVTEECYGEEFLEFATDYLLTGISKPREI